MEYVSTELLKEGMIVAKDVHSSSKMLLVPSGTELNASKIQTLKTWGIHRIFIEASEDLDSTQYVTKQKEVIAFVDEMFRYNPKNEFIDALKLAAGRYQSRKFSENA